MQFPIGLLLFVVAIYFIIEVVIPFVSKVMAAGLIGGVIAVLGAVAAIIVLSINRRLFWQGVANGGMSEGWLTMVNAPEGLWLYADQERISNLVANRQIASVVVSIIVVLVLNVLAWDSQNQGWCVLTLIASFILLFVAFRRWPDRFNASHALNEEIRNWLERVNSLDSLRELGDAIVANEKIAANLGIYFEQNYSRPIGEYASKHLGSLIHDHASINAAIKPALDEARSERQQLQQAVDDYAAVKQQYHQTATDVNRAGQPSMFMYLDELLVQLEASKDYLPDRRWSDFHKRLSEIDSDLKLLAENAQQSDGQTFEGGQDSVDEQAEDCYAVLGVKPDLDDVELDQVYKKLRGIYHPDKNIAATADRFKKIQAAYEQIKIMRGRS